MRFSKLFNLFYIIAAEERCVDEYCILWKTEFVFWVEQRRLTVV